MLEAVVAIGRIVLVISALWALVIVVLREVHDHSDR
jgi:hypothetical protein